MRRNYKNLKRRYARTLYYGRLTNRMDRLSLPLTEFVVEYFDAYAPFDYLDEGFANRLSLEGSVGPTTLIVAMIYLERLRLTDKNQFETSDPADLFSSALLCASKYLYDNDDEEFVYNDEWSASCSKSLEYINEKEIEFLTGIAWNLLAKEDDFQRSLKSVEKHVSLNEGLKRNFFVYSELCCLFNSWNEMKEFLATEILGPLLSLIGIATMTYIVSIFGMYAMALHVTNVKLQQHHIACKIPSDLKLGQVCPPVEPPNGFYARRSNVFADDFESEYDYVIHRRQSESCLGLKSASPISNVAVGTYVKSLVKMDDAVPRPTTVYPRIVACDDPTVSVTTAKNVTQRLLRDLLNLDISTMRSLL